jgi:Mrp family chromosome partitioning ATPase/capsular polysaccharide biosynthesis protein
LAEVSGLDGEPQGMALRDYAQVIVRRLWLIVLIVVVAIGAAFFYSSRQTKMYEATAKIMYAPQLNAANALTGQSAVDPYGQQNAMESVATAISSPVLQQRTAGLVAKQAPALATFKLTAQVESTSTTNLVNTVVDINATSSAPKIAQIAANAYAAAFIAWRKQVETGQINSGLAALQGQMAAFKTAVAKQSSNYLLLVQSAQSLEVRKATATGDFSVVAPASLPAAPYAPKPLRSAILGLAVGLFVAIGLAFLLEQFDTRLRGHDEVARILGRPIIGRIPPIRQSADKQPVVTLSDPGGHVAEAFRVLRGNLDFLALDSDVHSLAVTSSQQGEGKSVTTCNLAVAAALAGRRVILLEGDLRRPRIQEYLGLQNERGLSTVVTGTHKPMEALQRVDIKALDEAHGGVPGDGVDRPPGLYVLTQGPKVPNPGEIVASRTFAHLIEAYQRHADLVIIDTPAFLAVGDAAAIAGAVDGLVFVVDPSRVKRPVLQAAAEQLQNLPTRLLGVVVLQHQGRSTSYSYGYGYGSGPDSGYYSSTSVNGNGKSSRPRRRARSGSTS